MAKAKQKDKVEKLELTNKIEKLKYYNKFI
jgi:hypothetical protein